MKKEKFYPSLEGKMISIQPNIPTLNDSIILPFEVLFVVDNRIQISVSLKNAIFLQKQLKSAVDILTYFSI